MLEAILAIPFVLALVLLLMPERARRLSAWLAGLAPLTGLALLAGLTPRVMEGEVVRSLRPWVPELGLALSLRLDGLAWMFAGLVLAIGGLIVLYARYYLGERDHKPRFFGYLLLFMGAMLGVVTAGNLLLLVVFWELTSISSFLLIGFWFQREDAREGARMALTLTAGGGLALLGGALLLGRIVGSFELDAVLAAGPQILASPWYPLALGLVLLAVFTKSAQFPFHFWLPHAMAAPTPVSAYLHSAAMVKVGVFLLARLHPALAGSELFFYVVSGVGATTLLVGAWNAIFQHDLKGLLAYSTISHLGLITLLFGLGTPMAVVAGLFHILNHATFKASLFMAAGIIDHETGTRDMRRLGGLRRHMPTTAALAIIASLAMAGIPLLNGFLSKEMFFAEALSIEGHAGMRWFVSIAALLYGVFGVAYSLRFVHDTFFGKGPRAVEREPHEPPRFMRLPVAVLVLLCLAVGMLPQWSIGPTLDTAVRGVLGEAVPQYSLAVWHGINTPLLMSLAGIVGGICLYFGLRRLLDLHAVVTRSLGRHLFIVNIEALFRLARRFTHTLANGSMQRSLLWLVLAAVAAAAAPLLAGEAGLLGDLGTRLAGQGAMDRLAWVLWILLVGSALATLALYRHRLIAVVVLGGAGLAVSLTFVALSAPDLALTQLLVEMVTLSLLLLGLHYLPQRSPPERSLARRLRDGGIALVAGAGVALLAYAMMTSPRDTIAGEILARSLPEAWGANVVNVILVDFRGFDTFGEITVLAIAALGVFALIDGLGLPNAFRVAPDDEARHPLMLAVVARLVLPLALLVAVFLFLRGHQHPGSGFVAGLVVGVALILQYIASGIGWTRTKMPRDFHPLVASGLLLAGLIGIGSFLFAHPFLTGWFDYFTLPGIGKFELTSALVFDLGVFLTVVGGVLLILVHMGKAAESDAVRLPETGPRGE